MERPNNLPVGTTTDIMNPSTAIVKGDPSPAVKVTVPLETASSSRVTIAFRSVTVCPVDATIANRTMILPER